ncbi:hypothetical protein M427DRAFT_130632 [Gonapodya prolifera JEL478]|uniref:Uncharacterized protein n=1 Tax=Gonapodya prolifera (strain JEL478) TaxID=1344416 RepID=A0A139AYX7_GONPJ|nr:hypothetical protein M427DRAFT_130632 [Gonapodya prolifera JEL478]|eukprot:KXS21958.1 hypothetical protein M427DRAFT_130632 [Gonapodya prolifera JEL478]
MDGDAKSTPADATVVDALNKDHLTVLKAARSRFVIPIPYWLTPLRPGKSASTHENREHSNDNIDCDRALAGADGEWVWEEAGPSDAMHTPGVGGVAEDLDFQRRNYFARETSFACHGHSIVLVLRAPRSAAVQPQGDLKGDAAVVDMDAADANASQGERTCHSSVDDTQADVNARDPETGSKFPIIQSFNCRDRHVTASIDAAFMVLLEYPGAVATETPDILHHGFLIVDVSLGPKVRVGGRDDFVEALTLADVLVFNEYFRYYRCPYSDHYRYYKEFLGANPFDWRGTGPRTSAIHGLSRSDVKEAYLGRWDWMLACPVKLDEYNTLFTPPTTIPVSPVKSYWTVMPPEWISRAREYETSLRDRDSLRHYTRPDTVCGWLSYADSRAFVWTAVTGSAHLMCSTKDDSEGPPSGGWVRLLNVDQPGDSKPSRMEVEWASARTYMRWASYDTRYGFSDHSGVIWSESDDDAFLTRIFFSVYFDMALLLLYNRVVLFRFSSDLFDLAELTHARTTGVTTIKSKSRGGVPVVRPWSRISTPTALQIASVVVGIEYDPPWHPRKLAERGFLHAREQFSRFVDLYLFPLVSNQQQGVELYSLFRTAMDIDVLHNEIKAQVSDSHDFYNSKVGREQSNVLFLLTIVTFLSIPVSVMFGLLGASEWLTWTKRRLGFVDAADAASSSVDLASSGLKAGTVDDWFAPLLGSALLWGVFSILLLATLSLIGSFMVARMVLFRSERFLGSR